MIGIAYLVCMCVLTCRVPRCIFQCSLHMLQATQEGNGRNIATFSVHAAGIIIRYINLATCLVAMDLVASSGTAVKLSPVSFFSWFS